MELRIAATLIFVVLMCKIATNFMQHESPLFYDTKPAYALFCGVGVLSIVGIIVCGLVFVWTA